MRIYSLFFFNLMWSYKVHLFFCFHFYIGYVLHSTFICFCFQIYLHVIISISILSILTYDIGIEQGRRYGTPLISLQKTLHPATIRPPIFFQIIALIPTNKYILGKTIYIHNRHII